MLKSIVREKKSPGHDFDHQKEHEIFDSKQAMNARQKNFCIRWRIMGGQSCQDLIEICRQCTKKVLCHTNFLQEELTIM